MRLRGWNEFNERRVIPTPDGPVIAEKGDFVLVVVAESWDAATRAVLQLAEKGDGESR